MEYYDNLETRDPAEREAALFAALPQFLEGARRAPAIAERLKGIVSSEIRDRAGLARLPVLRKSELAESQRNDPPFGGFGAVSAGEAAHVFASPGPLYEPAGPGLLLDIQVRLLSALDGAARVSGEVRIDEKQVARVTLTFVLRAIDSERVHEQRRYLYRLWTRGLHPAPPIP